LQYSEAEAAEELGISVAQLRTMIRSHVVEKDEDLTNVPATCSTNPLMIMTSRFSASTMIASIPSATALASLTSARC
jgi:hypothetical protein